MPKFKPPMINLAASMAEGFDVTKSIGQLEDSLKFSPGGVCRKDGEGTESLELSESDLVMLSVLGHGACSVVHKALLLRKGDRHLAQLKYVAVKQMWNLDEGRKHQMQKDTKTLMDAAKAARSLDSPMEGLITFEGAFKDEETEKVTIVLEYMNAGSLADILKQKNTVPEPALSKITLMILKGLYYLHKQMHVVHRDIKPANILLNLDGVAKVADFGIARSLDNTNALCETHMGTELYMAPERLQTEQGYGFASDVWSLGLTLVECATGEYPFSTKGGVLAFAIEILQRDPKLPPAGQYSDELIDFCRACLHKDPAKRSTVVQLMAHPFILKHRYSSFDMHAFMRSIVNPQVTFDEVAFFFAHQYYQLLSSALQCEPALFDECIAVLALLYQPQSIYTFSADEKSKETAEGPDAIEALLKRKLRSMAGFGVRAFEVDKVECSGVKADPSGVLLHVRGKVVGQRGADEFAEAFVLVQQDTKGTNDGACYCIANQSMSMMG